MNEPAPDNFDRVLAVDVRARYLAHAIFDSSAQLLDFGTSRFFSARTAQAHFHFVVELMHPSIVVFRRMPRHGARNHPKTRRISGLMRRACRRLSLNVVLVDGREVRQHFRMRGAKTKQQIASLLANNFPILVWKLPPARKNFAHEHWNMPIFDAVGLGVAYFSRSIKRQEAMH